MSRVRKNELIALASGIAFCLVTALTWVATTQLASGTYYSGDCTANVPLMSSITTDIRC